MNKLILFGIAIMLVAQGAAARAQTSAELRARYSTPIREVYSVRPGIIATVTYGEGERIQTIEVTASAFPDGPDDTAAGLPEALVDALVDELMPASKRGAFLGEYDVEWSRIGQRIAFYEHAVVTRKMQGTKRAILSVTLELKEPKPG